MTFEVSHILKHPEPFMRGAGRTFARGLLVVTASEAYLIDLQTEQKLPLDPYGGWLEWLPKEIPPLEGEYIYFDEAEVAGLLRRVGDALVWKYVWKVYVTRGGKLFSSDDHEMQVVE
ncbi:MAG: hypothetical protein SFU83_22215 [Meiothermus sp.]|nr:hypothetical protein [Meiothermus sp.]